MTGQTDHGRLDGAHLDLESHHFYLLCVRLQLDGHQDLQLCWCSGYCQITCSRCKCCSTFSDLLQKKGLTSVLDAARAAGLGSQLDVPGTMLTLLAPTNAAFSAALSQLGKLPVLETCRGKVMSGRILCSSFPSSWAVLLLVG